MSCSGVFLEEPRDLQFSKSGPLCSISWARWIYTTSFHPVSLRSVLTLFSHLCQGFPNMLFIFLHQNSILISRLHHTCHIPCESPSWCMNLLILQFSQVSCSFHSLRFSYFPHHSVAEWTLSSYACTLTFSIGPFKSHIFATGQNTSQFKCILPHFLYHELYFGHF